ncbi:hypothetical protein [Pseudofulvimonas gallinarii]|nr:hypothetical protein [Pseudofulvimonas gallinarii]
MFIVASSLRSPRRVLAIGVVAKVRREVGEDLRNACRSSSKILRFAGE